MTNYADIQPNFVLEYQDPDDGLGWEESAGSDEGFTNFQSAIASRDEMNRLSKEYDLGLVYRVREPATGWTWTPKN